MNGMEMMLKSFGFDPEKLKAQLIEAQQQIVSKVTAIEESQIRIEASLLRLEIKFETLPDSVARNLLETAEVE